jgi:hypothetical protein
MARSFFGPPVVYICQHTHRKLPAHFFSLSTSPALLTYYYSLIPPSPSSQLIQSHSTCNIISLARTYTSHRPASHWFLPCGRRPSRCTLSPPPLLLPIKMDGVMRQHYQTNPPHRLPEERRRMWESTRLTLIRKVNIKSIRVVYL